MLQVACFATYVNYPPLAKLKNCETECYETEYYVYSVIERQVTFAKLKDQKHQTYSIRANLNTWKKKEEKNPQYKFDSSLSFNCYRMVPCSRHALSNNSNACYEF